MHQVAEVMVAEWIVAHVLHDTAAVGVSVSFLQLLGRYIGEPPPDGRDDVVLPCHVDDLLMREYGIGVGGQDAEE